MNITQAIPFPDKKYDIIYADPPWDLKDKEAFGSSPHIIPYPVMSTADICDMPVQSIAKDDSLLFMWTTGCFLEGSLKVGKAWGFKYITWGFVWDKQNPIKGAYTQLQVEICLLFKRGKIPLPRGKRNIRQFLSCKKGGHSVKPLQIQHRITEMFPTQSKIELFARPMEMTKMDGWDYWGLEVDNLISI